MLQLLSHFVSFAIKIDPNTQEVSVKETYAWVALARRFDSDRFLLLVHVEDSKRRKRSAKEAHRGHVSAA